MSVPEHTHPAGAIDPHSVVEGGVVGHNGLEPHDHKPADVRDIPADPHPRNDRNPCPNCGEVHGVANWAPADAFNIDRDITAIVMTIMNNGSVRDFAELVADEERLPSLFLRACQFIAQLYIALAHHAGGTEDHEEAMEIAKDMLQRALLAYSAGHNILGDDTPPRPDEGDV